MKSELCPIGHQLILDLFKGCLLASFYSGEYLIHLYKAHVPPLARSHGCDSDVPVFQLPGKQETIIIVSPGSWKTGNHCNSKA